MNEIQRFKKDRMIVKALDGTKVRYDAGNLVHAGRDTWGDYLYYDNRTGDLVKASSDPDKLKKDGWALGSIARSAKELKTNPYTSHGINWGFNPFNAIDTHAFGSYQGKLIGKPAVKLAAKVQTNAAEPLTVQQPDMREVVATGKARKPAARVTPKGLAYWDNQYQDFLSKMTDDLKAWLAQRGIDYSSAEKMQSYLTRIGKDVGKFGADNKWGNASQAAWDDLVNTTMKNNPLLAPIKDVPKKVEPVVDAPDPFGYESKGNYALDNARTLKTNGIRDWTTMMNYIKGNQESAFAQDMMHRFGSDLSTWKQEDVEGAIGVSGHYGSKDRSRIQGFMAGNQATWNNQRQAAINDYAKKTFLANPSGANTLGNQPGLSKEWAGADGTA